MPLKRTQHWATREYHTFLHERRSQPFAWGKHDCCLFAADGIKAFTGTDIASDFRGKYNDQASALTAIHSITGGGRTVADAAAWVAKKHGLTEWKHPLMAQRGDLAVAKNGDGSMIVGLIHLNGRHIVTVGEKGSLRLPISSILRAWHV